MEDVSKLYNSDNSIDENANMRLKYLQAQADAQPDPQSIDSMIADKITILAKDLFQFISRLGTIPLESIPYSLYITLNKGDNMFICGVLMSIIGLLGVAFSSDVQIEKVRV